MGFKTVSATDIPHALLSVTHNDTTPASPVVGDLIAGTAGPVWSRLSIGNAGDFLKVVGGSPSWQPLSAIDHGGLGGLADDDHPQYVLHSEVDDAPVDGATTDPISSNWAFDHVAAADPHPGYLTPAEGNAAYAPITEPIAAAHILNGSDAHDASAISILDTANDFTATDVEGALAELQSDAEGDAQALADHLADVTSVHDHGSLSGLADDDHAQYVLHVAPDRQSISSPVAQIGVPIAPGSGPQTTGILTVGINDADTFLDTGVIEHAPWGIWVQPRNAGNSGNFSFCINPTSNGLVGIGNSTPSALLTLSSALGPTPTLVAASPAILSLDNKGGNTNLVVGIDYTTSPPTSWLQHRHTTVDGFAYPILLNPLGGNVGIGHRFPITALDVKGPATDYTVDTVAVFRGGGVGTGAGCAIDFREFYDGNYPDWTIGKIAARWAGGATWKSDLKFYANAGSAPGDLVERMTILANGFTGIGTAAPATLLHVSDQSFGSAQITADVNAGGVVALNLARAGVSLWNLVITDSLNTDLQFFDGVATRLRLKQGGPISTDCGLHVGGNSDPGDNNLLVDGTIVGATVNGMSAAQVTDLTDGGLTSLHSHELALSQANSTSILLPRGGAYTSNGFPETGAIKIRLPQLKSNTMMRFTVKIYSYEPFIPVRTFVIGGYNYSDGGWYNVASQQHSSTGDAPLNVRFGDDGVGSCVWIGETTANWYYPKIWVTDCIVGLTTYAIEDWNDGWVVSIVNAFDTVALGPLLSTMPQVNNISDVNATDLTDGGATTLHKHDHGGMDGLGDNDHPQYVLVADIDDTPVDGITNAPISSNWAYDHVAAADPHTGYVKENDASWTDLTDAGATTLHKHDHGGMDGLADDDHPQYALIRAINNFRLLLSGGNLTLKPINGNSIYINGIRYTYTTMPTLAVAGLSNDTTYFIYLYDNAGTAVLEASATGYTENATYGFAEKTGDATRRLVGMARPTGGAFVDSISQRFVISRDNRLTLHGLKSVSSGRTTSSVTGVELSSADRVEFLSWSEQTIHVFASGYIVHNTAGGSYFLVYPTIDGVNINAGSLFQPIDTNGFGVPIAIGGTAKVADGYHYYSTYGGVASGTGTWPQNNSHTLMVVG